jgi:hypothetical protein
MSAGVPMSVGEICLLMSIAIKLEIIHEYEDVHIACADVYWCANVC